MQFTAKGTYTREYQFTEITSDSLILKDDYKGQPAFGGYLKRISDSELIFCRYKTHPERSGDIDFVYYFKRHGYNEDEINKTDVIFPNKQGRYVLEFAVDGIVNDYTEDRKYTFNGKQLKVNAQANMLEYSRNDYNFYMQDSSEPMLEYSKINNLDSLLELKPDTIIVMRLGMNAFSHYKIYQYDSLHVYNDAEYFFVGSLQKAHNFEIFDRYD